MAMLDTLKNLVYQKQLFAEQARMVLDEDDNFDQLLLEDAEATDPNLPEGTKDPLQNDNSQVQPEGEQPMPIDTDTEPSSANDDGDIMNMELDARTDTVSNVVPSPPASAGDQVETPDSPNGGDIMDQEISDEEDDGSDAALYRDPAKEEPEEAPQEDLMNEKIPLEKDEDVEEPSEDDQKDESGDIMEENISDEEESTELDEDEQLEAAGIRIIDNVDEDEIFNESINLDYSPYSYSSDIDIFEESVDVYEEDSEDEDIFNEAISLDGDDSSGSDGGDLEPPKPEGEGDSAPDSDLSPEGDNPVTAAVKDKVGESNDDSSIEPSEPGSDDNSSLEATPAANNDELMKKVANITKSQIDLMAQLQASR